MPNSSLRGTTYPRIYARVKIDDLAPEDLDSAVRYLYTAGLEHQSCNYHTAEAWLATPEAQKRRTPGFVSVLAIGVNTPGQDYDVPGRYFTMVDAPAQWHQEHILVQGGLQALKDTLVVGCNDD